jgi:hypothetical protein
MAHLKIKGVNMSKENKTENKNTTLQRVMVNDGLDTSTAKMLLNAIKNTQTIQTQSTPSKKEIKK